MASVLDALQLPLIVAPITVGVCALLVGWHLGRSFVTGGFLFIVFFLAYRAGLALPRRRGAGAGDRMTLRQSLSRSAILDAA